MAGANLVWEENNAGWLTDKSSEHTQLTDTWIYFQLSMWRCNDELRARAQEIHSAPKKAAKHYIGDKTLLYIFPLASQPYTFQIWNTCWREFICISAEFWKQIPLSEPYRVVLGDVRDKLYNTRERARQLLTNEFSDIPEELTFSNVQQVM